ncbi:serine/threonine-protein kinase [Mycobacterium avium]|uniref:serine/threonine-protein kinase n=3 Tax=Mycobacterium avium TaxID=1764 RepID=UPI0027DEB9C4|nr:serine/threonine-protein kinase [Mycobacterium avium]MBZ4612456.1 protein kinase [Mycobacterium avium subsp. hominissuis]
MPLSENDQFAGYTVLRRLGGGAMGEVYLARHPRLPRLEALKVLRTELSGDPGFEQRFNREADRASALWHPHIVGVHDRGKFDGQLWIAMDYVDGPDLGTVLTQRGGTGLSTGEVVAAVTAAAEALDHAHQRGLLHRDVKPQNIMISRPEDGSAPRILLSDFGIARPAADDADLTQITPSHTDTTAKMGGAYDYTAPEQLRGEDLDGRADQYALAATAYHLLTGTTPFPHGNPVAIIKAHLTASPPRPSATRPELAATDPVFARALAKDPALRFDRCSDFAAALGSALQLPAAPSPPPADPTMAAPAASPHPTAWAPLTAPPSSPPGPHPPAPPAHFPPGPPPWQASKPPRTRKRAIILAAAVAAVAVLAAGGIFAAHQFSGPDANQRAAQDREAARLSGQHYLEALASGDAHTVLALSAQPPATPQLLTDKALSAQLSATPITDIVVTNTAGQDPQASPDNQQLTLSAKFGPTPSQTAITAHRQDGQWKLETTTVSVTITAPPDADAAMKTLTVSGVEVNGRNPISVFPGTPQVGSSNRYIDITAPPTPLLLEALGQRISSPTITPSIALNDAGRKASLDALDHRLHYCFAGAAPPEGCCPPGGCKRSQSAADPDTENLIALDSSQDMNYQLDPERMRVHLTGTLNYRAEAKSRGQTIPVTSSFTVDSNIDLTTEPPVYIPRGQ